MNETTVYIKQPLYVRIGLLALSAGFAALCFFVAYTQLQEPNTNYLIAGALGLGGLLFLFGFVVQSRKSRTAMILQQDGIKVVWLKDEPLLTWTNLKQLEKVVLPGKNKQEILGIYVHEPITPTTKTNQALQQLNGVILNDSTPPDIYIPRTALAKSVDKTIQDINTYRTNNRV